MAGDPKPPAQRDEAEREAALDAALGALRHRDHSTSSLEAKLERRGIGAAPLRQAVETLTRVGLVDDARFAHARARALADRGAGDLLIADDLGGHGVAAALVQDAIAELEPEAARAEAIVSRRGAGPKTWRYLAGKGFSGETLESLVAAEDGGAIA